MKDITNLLDKQSQKAGFTATQLKDGSRFLSFHGKSIISVFDAGRTHELETFLKGFHLGRIDVKGKVCTQ